MCTSPITITRKDACSNSVKTYVVPCGKCAECTKKKQLEFAALSLHQALECGNMHFFTFTYSNDSLPVAISESFDSESPRLVGFQRGCSDYWLDAKGNFKNRLVLDSVDNSGEHPIYTHLACSLCREDVKKVLKQFRKGCPDAKFKYAIFGELGEQHGRPHYHGLFYGLTSFQAHALASLWRERFGFVHYAPLHDGQLSLDDLTAMSMYASKYVSKGVHTLWSDLLPYIEKPRRQSSLDFGSFSSDELNRLASFMKGAISENFWNPDFVMMISWLCSRLDALLSNWLEEISLSPNV